jgi:hypothetical protein
MPHQLGTVRALMASMGGKKTNASSENFRGNRLLQATESTKGRMLPVLKLIDYTMAA